MRETLSDIAAGHLGIGTLEQQGSGQLDFHEVSVWSLREALQAAYDAGQASIVAVSMTAVLNVLAGLLADAGALASQAAQDAAEGLSNRAIGGILSLDETLPAAHALLKAAIALHRQSGKAGA